MRHRTGLLGWIGAVLLIFGLLSLVLQLFSDFVFAGFDLPWIWGNFVIGALFLGVALVSNLDALRERLHTGEARRAGRYGTAAILSTGLVLALLVMLAFLSTRYHVRWDWTETGSHSLSDQTLKLLADLEEPVVVTALYAAVAAPPARELLGRYEYVSDRFQVEYVDPQARPGLVRELGVSERISFHRFGLDNTQWKLLDSTAYTELITALRQNNIIKTTASSKLCTRWYTEIHGERNRLVIAIMFSHHLPHV